MQHFVDPEFSIPVIDIHDLVLQDANQQGVAREIHDACRQFGFFYITGHLVDIALQHQLQELSKHFFALPLQEKNAIRMELAGRSWRGFFPVGGELTSGKPDLKEGIYFGEELDDHHPLVMAKTLLHGPNLFPQQIPEFREVVLTYMGEIKRLGHHLMRGLSLSLGLPASYIHDQYTYDPLCLFRVFHYPPTRENETNEWGVGEHTDYGLLTILKQDEVGGLQIKVQGKWINAPYIENAFVCNIGDMLEKLTGGYYRSTPHRVFNRSGKERYSFPFFFDPSFDAEIQPIDMSALEVVGEIETRWDQLNIHAFRSNYGEYLISKVSKVFPELLKRV